MADLLSSIVMIRDGSWRPGRAVLAQTLFLRRALGYGIGPSQWAARVRCLGVLSWTQRRKRSARSHGLGG